MTPIPRFALTAAVLLCICLIFIAPAAADTVMVSTLDELTSNLTGTFTDRTIVVTQTIDAKNNAFTIDSGKNVTLMPGSIPGVSINRTSISTSDSSMFQILSGGNLILVANATIPASTLTIDGGNLERKKVSLILVYGGNFTMHAGTLTNNTALYGGGVYVMGDDSTFTMSGGEISSSTAQYGGGVYVMGDGSTFTMSGGKISGNTASAIGGGVYVKWDDNTFTMSGGEISDNIANSIGGGGVYVEGDDSTFMMSGGKISGNTARSGGGVHVQNNSMFMMSGGEISDNTATIYGGGGGVYVEGNDSTFTMSGGKISGNTAIRGGGGVYVKGDGNTFTMSGNAEINADNELYLGSNEYVTLSGSTFTGSVKNISGDTDVIILDYKLIRMMEGLEAHNYRSNFVLQTTEYILIPDESDTNLIVANPVYLLTVINGIGSGRYSKDEIIHISATVPSGKTFDHWETTGVTLTSPSSETTTFGMPANDVTATAVFKGSPIPPSPSSGNFDGNMENSFRVLFETLGGSSVPPHNRSLLR